MKRAWQLAIVLALACTAASGEAGIKTVVRLIENRYSAHHHGVPGLWLAKPFMFGSGVGGLKIAEFENLRLPADDAYALKEEVQRALGPEWFPFIETWSKFDGEWSAIYSRANGEDMQLLIVTSEQNEGLTVLQMNVSGKARQEWFDEPFKCAIRNKKTRSTDKSNNETAKP